MSLTLPQPAGLLRAKLENAIALLVSEADRDEVIVAVLRAMDDVGFPIYGNGWLDDDESLRAAFREEGLNAEGMPEEMLIGGEIGGEVFLNEIDLDDDLSGLPSSWPDTDEDK